MSGNDKGAAGPPAAPGSESSYTPNPDDIVPHDPESDSFVKALVARGEAAKPGPDGELPPKATHEIVGTTATGLPILRRRRYRAF